MDRGKKGDRCYFFLGRASIAQAHRIEINRERLGLPVKIDISGNTGNWKNAASAPPEWTGWATQGQGLSDRASIFVSCRLSRDRN